MRVVTFCDFLFIVYFNCFQRFDISEKMSGHMFSPDLYSIDSSHWEELENISLPSLPFPIQFPDTPLEDEADLLPMLELDPDLQLHLEQSCEVSPESLVDDLVTRLEVSDELSRVHVMVCGFCHSVFHFIDEGRTSQISFSYSKHLSHSS